MENLPYLIQNAFWPLLKLRLSDSLVQHFLAKQPPHYQEGHELDNFIQFVPQASYDLTESTPHQFPIERDIVQLEEFTRFLSGSTEPSPRQFSYNHEVIQSLSSF